MALSWASSSKCFVRRCRLISATLRGRDPRKRTAASYASPSGGASRGGRLALLIRAAGRHGARLLADLGLDLRGDIRVVAEELLRVLAALAKPGLPVVEPCAVLRHDAGEESHIDEPALARDALDREDLELGETERRRDLVLHDLHPHAPADDVGAVLDLLDRAHVEADRRVELQRLATRSGLRASEHHTDLLAQLVDEDDRRLRLRDGSGDLPEGLAHEPGLEADVRIPHLALDLGLRHERGDGVDDYQVDRPAPHERVGDLEGLLAVVRLRDEELIRVHAADPRPAGVQRMLGVDEGRGAAPSLYAGNGVQREGRLA